MSDTSVTCPGPAFGGRWREGNLLAQPRDRPLSSLEVGEVDEVFSGRADDEAECSIPLGDGPDGLEGRAHCSFFDLCDAVPVTAW